MRKQPCEGIVVWAFGANVAVVMSNAATIAAVQDFLVPRTQS